MNDDAAKKLREPFPPEQIGKLPRITCKNCRDARGKVCEKHSKSECRVCGNWITSAHLHLDYVGHAEATDRLLEVDPEWSWKPVAFTETGIPLIEVQGSEAKLWIRLTVAGTTRLGVGIVEANKAELEKQLISDALRNAAMRFGVALDLWAKSELHPEPELPPAEPMASKHDVDLFKACIDELEDDNRSEFLAWKTAHDFPWPWTQAALDAMEAELERIVGAEVPQAESVSGTAAPSAPTTSPDQPEEPGSEPGTDDHPSAASSGGRVYDEDDLERPFVFGATEGEK